MAQARDEDPVTDPRAGDSPGALQTRAAIYAHSQRAHERAAQATLIARQTRDPAVRQLAELVARSELDDAATSVLMAACLTGRRPLWLRLILAWRLIFSR